jgi:hypothetical protein
VGRIQFNCRLEEATVEAIEAERTRLAALTGQKVSQADVIELRFSKPLKTPKSATRKQLAIQALRDSDPMAAERPDVEYGSNELPSGGSVAKPENAITRPTRITEEAKWRKNRQPLLKPKDRKK